MSKIYFGENGCVQDETGAFYTTDQGYGRVGYILKDETILIDLED